MYLKLYQDETLPSIRTMQLTFPLVAFPFPIFYSSSLEKQSTLFTSIANDVLSTSQDTATNYIPGVFICLFPGSISATLLHCFPTPTLIP